MWRRMRRVWKEGRRRGDGGSTAVESVKGGGSKLFGIYLCGHKAYSQIYVAASVCWRTFIFLKMPYLAFWSFTDKFTSTSWKILTQKI